MGRYGYARLFWGCKRQKNRGTSIGFISRRKGVGNEDRSIRLRVSLLVLFLGMAEGRPGFPG